MQYHSEFLVIDDDEINNYLCKSVIKKVTGNENVQTFTSPELGIEYVEQTFNEEPRGRRAMILLDLNMPNLSGWEVLKRFEKFSDRIKEKCNIFILTSSIDRSDKEKERANEFTHGYIEKPLTPEKISSLLSFLYASA
jgi:CheY-like chemotaxis protein